MDTKNEGPSAEALELALAAWDAVGNELRPTYAAKFAPKIDAALSRAREDARREALEACEKRANSWLVMLDSGDCGEYQHSEVKVRRLESVACWNAVRDLISNTPQGESRVDQKRPPPPEALVDALQDRVHPASGRLIHSKPVKPQGETKERS